MSSSSLMIRVFAAPMVACGNGETWRSAALALGERLRRRFGDQVDMEFVELFSSRSFECPDVLVRVEAGGQLPLVTIGDEVISEGGKPSEPLISRALAERGVVPR